MGEVGFEPTKAFANGFTARPIWPLWHSPWAGKPSVIRLLKQSPPREGIEASRHQGTTPGPYLLANMTEFGKTPLIPLSRFAELGYDLVIYPVTMLRVALGAVTRALETLKAEGTVASFLDDMQSRQELYDLVWS